MRQSTTATDSIAYIPTTTTPFLCDELLRWYLPSQTLQHHPIPAEKWTVSAYNYWIVQLPLLCILFQSTLLIDNRNHLNSCTVLRYCFRHKILRPSLFVPCLILWILWRILSSVHSTMLHSNFVNHPSPWTCTHTKNCTYAYSQDKREGAESSG